MRLTLFGECEKHTSPKSALSNCVDGVTGEADGADMWNIHYETY